MNDRTEIYKGEELLNCVKRSLPGCTFEEKLPDYVPPVILHTGALKWLSVAVELLAEIGSSAECHRLHVHYADDRDRSDCRLVISMETSVSANRRPLAVDHTWADRMGQAEHELIAHSVALKYFFEQDALYCNFEFPVFGRNATKLRHRNSILLVEDDNFVRNSTREILEGEGYRVLTAERAESGLDQFSRASKEVGLVITDLTMPGPDGFTLAKAIRLQDKRVPILFISGFGAVVPEDPAMQTYFLAKPYSARLLMAAIGRCFRGYHELNLLHAFEQEPHVPTVWL
ncbi:response regulator receiver protein [Candidatus Koribacter versatilis Ellin345]|uniref:Response regulator receiver protein n=1 Tax=Koribacter versatilis (strain Ellin345) TaxID=204669 RepID=Q1IMG0_KORVE|nr:response regulator [Candidatus Koribacter versatilis]ABF41940.1 response regulator receiver protein [Candidatus Koribacter versatilis Ellin345]